MRYTGDQKYSFLSFISDMLKEKGQEEGYNTHVNISAIKKHSFPIHYHTTNNLTLPFAI